VAAGASELEAEPTGAHGLRHDAVVARTVHDHRRVCRPLERGEEVARAAQVAHPFLAGRRGEADRAARAQRRARERLGHREHRGQAARVVADAGPDEAWPVVLHAQVGLRREDRVEVRGDDDCRGVRRCARAPRAHVAGIIGGHAQAEAA
jgi:hypothetical protein